MNDYSGTGVAVVTPFTAEKQVDVPALRRILTHLIDGKVEYLVALGTTAEAATLTEAEQDQVLDIFFEVAGNKIPIVIGAGGNNTKKLTDTIRKLEKNYQPAAFLSVCPYYNKPSQEGLFQHFKAVCASTDRDIILYNVPGRTASNLAAQTTLRLAQECSNAKAIKEASGNLEQIMEIIRQAPNGFQVLSGDDYLSLPILALGGRGTISVIANALPSQFGEMIRAGLNNEWGKARSLHYQIMRIEQLIFEEGNPSGIKSLLSHLRLCEPSLRLPLVPASQGLDQRIMQELEKISAPVS